WLDNGVPAGVNVKPHVPLTHVRVWHSVSEPLHCVAALHCTQAPEPSQKVPPPLEQAVFTGLLGCEGTPDEQISAVQSRPSSAGTSESSATLVVPPSPAHSACWQSPAVCADSAVPASAANRPHAPFTQVRAAHSVSEPGHCDAAMHCTHAPVPSQKLPPIEHAVPCALGGCDATPMLHTSVV